MAPPHNDGLCRKCGQPGHRAASCRPTQEQSTRARQPRNLSAGPPTLGRGHVNHVKVEEARRDPKIVMGTLLVNSDPTTVLFDLGASHSFISEAFARKQDLSFKNLYPPLVVSSLGSRWDTSMIAHNNHIEIGGLVFTASLMALKVTTIDVILGMNWLGPHQALIDCAAETVQLTHPSGQTVKYSARTAQGAES